MKQVSFAAGLFAALLVTFCIYRLTQSFESEGLKATGVTSSTDTVKENAALEFAKRN